MLDEAGDSLQRRQFAGEVARRAVAGTAAQIASAASSVKPPVKTVEGGEQILVLGRQQVVAPGDRLAHRLLPHRQVTGAAGQERQTLFQPGQECRRRQESGPRRSQLDRQRQPIHPAHDLSDGEQRLCADSAKSRLTACARSINRRTAPA